MAKKKIVTKKQVNAFFKQHKNLRFLLPLLVFVILLSGSGVYVSKTSQMEPSLSPTPRATPTLTPTTQPTKTPTPYIRRKTKAFDELRTFEVLAYGSQLGDYKKKYGKYPNTIQEMLPEFAINRDVNGVVIKAPFTDPETGAPSDIFYEVAPDGQTYTIYGTLSTGGRTGSITVITQYPGGQ